LGWTTRIAAIDRNCFWAIGKSRVRMIKVRQMIAKPKLPIVS
jgi:hypothetical protein